MKSLDINYVRNLFPAFSCKDHKDMSFFDSAGGSYCNEFVINRLNRFYVERKMQPYAPNKPSFLGGEEMDQAYKKIAELLNIDKLNVFFGPSTSQNTYVLSNAFREMKSRRKTIIVTNQDHEANSGVWRKLSNHGFKIVEWCVDKKTGLLDPNELKKIINEDVLLVAFPHCSNIIGYVNPTKEICKIIKSCGSFSCIDGVSYVPHGFPDLKKINCDIYLFSTYKTYGPHIGVMYLSESLNQKLPNQGHYFNATKNHKKFYPAGPDHAQIASLVGISDYIEEIYKHHFTKRVELHEMSYYVKKLQSKHEKKLLKKLLSFLNYKKIAIVGTKNLKNRVSTVSLDIKKPAKQIAKRMYEDGILIDGGDFYAVRLLEFLGINISFGVLRLSFVHYNTLSDIEKLIISLDKNL